MKLAEFTSQAEGRNMQVVGKTVEGAGGKTVGETIGEAVSGLVAGASVEVAPRQILGDPSLISHLPAGTQVYVPFLPRAGFSETVEACQVLASRGFDPVAHVAARRVESRGQLRDWLAALQGAGVNALMLIAGDRAASAGPFQDTLGIFESGLLESHGFCRIGVAGHPEGHPVADVVALDQALKLKLAYARATGAEMWLVSQFAFGSAQVIAWLERLRGKGFEIPVRVGIPGPANLKTLFAYAAYCGVEASARLLSRRPGAARLLANWAPDGLVQDLGHYRATHPGAHLCGIHLYSFGGVVQCAQWLAGLRSPTPATRIQTPGAA